MQWLVETIQETCQTPLSLDSQKPAVIASGLKVLNAANGAILNSAPLNRKTDEEILDKYMEMANQAGPKVGIIALTMDKNGVPQDIDTRVAIAAEIVQKAMEKGFEIGCLLTPSFCQLKCQTRKFSLVIYWPRWNK